MVEGLLLDFYGTIVDEDDAVVDAICAEVAATTPGATAGDVGRAWWQALESSLSGPFRPQRELAVDSLGRAMQQLGAAGDPDQLCAAQFAYWRRPGLRPGAAEFLSRLRRTVCIVSNIDRDDLLIALEHRRLTPTAIVTSEDTRTYKPHPAMFEQALAALDLPAAAALHVGDSWTADVEGAHRAGIRVAWINRRYRPVPRPGLAALVLGELDQLDLARAPGPETSAR